MKNSLDKLFESPVIQGRFCEFHYITIDDARLVYDLRKKRPKYLEKTYGGIESQKSYLNNYAKSFNLKEQIYYKIFDIKKNNFNGVFRLTMLDDDSHFSWESAVFDKNSSPNCFIDTMLMTYRIGFEFLGRKQCGPWNVKKGFTRMMEMHSKMKMVRILNEDDFYYVVCVKSEDYYKHIEKYKKLGFGKLIGLL